MTIIITMLATTAEKPMEEDKDTDELVQEEEPPKGCWYNFTHCLGGMWSTRQMNNNDDREIFVRTTIRELVVYCIFLIVLCVRE